MSKTKKRVKQWPRISTIVHRSERISYRVDLGMVEGKRKMVPFATKAEAETYAEQARVMRANDGTGALTLPNDVRMDAYKGNQMVAPHGVTILDACKYYQKHVL